jgi:periplasmic protein TonB
MGLMRRTATVAAFALVAIFGAVDTTNAQAIYPPSELTEQPRLQSPRTAQREILSAYPRALQAAGVGGEVMLQLVVLADGSVDATQIQVVGEAHEGLAQAARTAIQKIRFIPGEIDGQAVATRVIIPIAFTAP